MIVTVPKELFMVQMLMVIIIFSVLLQAKDRKKL